MHVPVILAKHSIYSVIFVSEVFDHMHSVNYNSYTRLFMCEGHNLEMMSVTFTFKHCSSLVPKIYQLGLWTSCVKDSC